MRLHFGNAVGIGLLLLASLPVLPAPQALSSKPPVVPQSPQKGVPGAKLPLVPPQPPQKGGTGAAPSSTSLTALKPPVPAPPPDRLLYGIEVAWEDMFRGANEHQDAARAQRMLELMRRHRSDARPLRLATHRPVGEPAEIAWTGADLPDRWHAHMGPRSRLSVCLRCRSGALRRRAWPPV